jgi:hypothetical protein
VSPVKYELGFYIPEDDIVHSHCHDNLTSYSMIEVLTKLWVYLTIHTSPICMLLFSGIFDAEMYMCTFMQEMCVRYIKI